MSNTASKGAEPFQIFHPLRRYAVAPLDGAPREQVEVGKFIILSMLLHVLLVILFGDSTGGGPSRASQMLGGFSASLQARVTKNAPASPTIKSTTVSGADANPRAPRTATPVTIEPLKPSAAPAESIDAANAEPTVVAPTVPEKVSVPDALPTIAKSVVKPVSEFVVAPVEVTPKAAVETVPPVDPLPPLSRAQPLTVPKPIELNANPSVSREFAPYVPPVLPTILPPTLPPSIAPISPAAPIAPLAMPPVTPLALPTIAAPKIAREFVAPANIEVREPLVVPPPISTIAPTTESKTEREFVPYVPPNVVPNVAPAPAAAVSSTASPALPNTTPNTTSAPPATTPPSERSLTPAPSSSAPAATPGSPTPAKSADDIFGPRRDAGSVPAPIKSLDLDAARRSAREGANTGTGPRTLLPFPTAPKPIPKSDIAKIFDKALKRPDCKDAYAEMGLAAVIPLVRDAIKQEGCKW